MIAYYCINRVCDTGRRVAMEAEARREGLELTFVPAIEGATVDYDDPKLGYNRRGRLRAFADMGRGEIAIVCSQRRVLEQFLAGTAECAVVLEDDAKLADGFVRIVEQVVRRSHGWHLLRLERRGARRGYTIGRVGKGVELYAPLDAELGFVGVLYSREGARIAHRALQRFMRPLDEHLALFWRWGLRVVELDPPIVQLDETCCTTVPQRGGRRRRGFRAWLWTRPIKVHGVAKRLQAFCTSRSVRVLQIPSEQVRT